MPEMPDVVTLTTITSDWGNDIRDRTVQRYSSVANRTTEHPTPTEGDLSYLTDTNGLYFYNGSSWVPVVNNLDGAMRAGTITEVVASALITSFQNKAILSFDKPNSWNAYWVIAWATVHGIVNNPTGSGILIEAQVALGGSNGPVVSAGIASAAAGEVTLATTHTVNTTADPLSISVQVRETGSHASYEWSSISYIAYATTWV